MSEKYEFASPAWVNHIRMYLEKELRDTDLSGVDIAFCEEFTDAPAHLADSNGSVAWHLVIKDCEVTVSEGAIDSPAKVLADYQVVLELARIVIDPSDVEQAAELEAIVGAASAAGKFDIKGEVALASVDALAGLHNELAIHTA